MQKAAAWRDQANPTGFLAVEQQAIGFEPTADW
jgi:hypothetical protein